MPPEVSKPRAAFLSPAKRGIARSRIWSLPMEYIALSLFCILLFLCLMLDVSILLALLAGLLVFFIYGLCRGYALSLLAKSALEGIQTVHNILITFLLIGMLTALWRAAGTIPVIVCLAARLIRPPVFLLMTFLLNCLISVLTGTAFGTAATMGVICSTMGASLGAPPALMGGAILSGAFFGDRCSPVSTSALLISTLTGTSIFANIRRMLRSAALPFLIACAAYGISGALLGSSGEIPDLSAVFGREFVLSPLAALPAVVLLALSLCRVNVKGAMAASILATLPICLLMQGTPVQALPSLLLKGYTAAHADVGAMLNGGGVASMVKVAAIVCISSAYSGIFRVTGLLKKIKASLHRLADRTTAFAAVLLTSILTGMIACNQTLSIMLTDQLTGETMPKKDRFAIALEDSAVVISPLIPWSIAGAVPLASVGAPTQSILFACFLYLLPLCHLIRSLVEKRGHRKAV